MINQDYPISYDEIFDEHNLQAIFDELFPNLSKNEGQLMKLIDIKLNKEEINDLLEEI